MGRYSRYRRRSLSIDNIADLKNCTETVGDRIKITGNVDPSYNVCRY